MQESKVQAAIQGARNELTRNRQGTFETLKQEVADAVVDVVAEIRRDLLGSSDEGSSAEALHSLRIPTHDVEKNCDYLRDQLNADRFQGRLLCRKIGDLPYVPVSDTEYWLNEAAYADGLQHDVRWLPTDEAVDGFLKELESFLLQRIAGSIYLPERILDFGGLISAPTMLSVNVASHTSGARVEYSPAYFHQYIVLSAPTSPVSGMVLPGRYIFLISKRATKKYDKGVFDIPPSFSIQLLV